MREHKNTTTSAATPAVAKEPRPTFQSGPHSYSQSTTFTPPGQELLIAGLLSHGADHGLHLSDLARLTDLSERAVRQQIEAERRTGALIVSDNRHGYWIANDSEEVLRFVRSMQHRAREILRTARAVERAAGRL